MLPGFAKEDVQINYHKNLLTVKVDKQEESEKTENYKYAHREFGRLTSKNSFRCPTR
jgi:HSP20 family protein